MPIDGLPSTSSADGGRTIASKITKFQVVKADFICFIANVIHSIKTFGCSNYIWLFSTLGLDSIFGLLIWVNGGLTLGAWFFCIIFALFPAFLVALFISVAAEKIVESIKEYVISVNYRANKNKLE